MQPTYSFRHKASSGLHTPLGLLRRAADAAIALIRRTLRSRSALELAAIGVIWLLYAGVMLSYWPGDPAPGFRLRGLEPQNRLGGVEYERLAGVLLPVQIGLGLAEGSSGYDHVPTWNPYLWNSGKPLLNDAFNYLFNPFASLPVLLLGGVQGSKVAVLLALLLAGCNTWALARAIGLGGLGRVLAGALYMLSGGIAAKFYTGHFQLGLSLAWPPLVLAGLWWTLNTGDRRAPVLMAAAFTLMFFTGNIYYTLHVIVGGSFIVLLHLFSRDQGRWKLRLDRLKRVGLGALFTVGLSLIQFMPIWTVRDFVEHEDVIFNARTGQLDSQYDMAQAALNFVYPWEDWRVFEEAPFLLLVVVDYAYIGPTTFLLIGALGAALAARQVRSRGLSRAALCAFILALAMTVWGAGQTPVLTFLYSQIPLLAEFRYVGRVHSIAALWWIVLAAVAADVLWRAAPHWLRVSRADDASDGRRLRRAVVVATTIWGFFLLYSLSENATRLALALNNPALYSFLNEQALVTFPQAAMALWFFVLAFVALDALLLIPNHIVSPDSSLRKTARLLVMRALRWGLIAFTLTAVADVMEINSRLFPFGPPVHQFDRLYPFVRASNSTAPFPSIHHPFSPSAFDGYYAEIRNWFLDEGWTPEALPNAIPGERPNLTSGPEWAIVSTEYGGASFEFGRDFVNRQEHLLVGCSTNATRQNLPDPCNLDRHGGAALYRLPQALPYAFVMSQALLFEQADAAAPTTVQPARVLEHRQDTITIYAEAPQDSGNYFLIVQETHFPGWRAFVEGMPVETLSAGKFTAVRALPGGHTYTLRFDPPGLSAGIIGTLATLVVVGFYLGRRKLALYKTTGA